MLLKMKVFFISFMLTLHNCTANQFQMYKTEKKTFNDALTFCASVGQSLASVRSAQEENVILSQNQNTDAIYWIGMASFFTSYMWLDRTVKSYTNFATPDPSVSSATTKCVQMHIYKNGTSLWYSRECNLVEYFICRKVGTSDQPTTRTPTTATETLLTEVSPTTVKDRTTSPSTASMTTTNAANVTAISPPKERIKIAKLLQAKEARLIALALASNKSVPDSGDPLIEIQVRRSTPKESSAFNETTPFIGFTQTSLNRIIPVGIKDTDTFITVASQTKENKTNLELLLEPIPDTNLKTFSFILDEPTVISITALNASSNVLQASANFNFNLSTDNLFKTTYTPEVFSVFRTARVTKRRQYDCRFIDYGSGTFADTGCRSSPTIFANHHQCSCDHLTPFAVLLSVTSYTVPIGVKILSFVTEGISVICLSATLVILCVVRKKLRSDRTVVQINLTLALLLLHIFSMLHDPLMINFRLCEMAAVLIHFFLLASAMWGLVEGITLVWKTMDQGGFSKLHSWQRKTRLAIGWGIPCFITVIAVAVGFSTQSYMDLNPDYVIDQLATRYNRCSVKPGSGVMIGAVVVPLATILFINLAVVVRMAYFVYRMSKHTEGMKPSANTSEERKSDVGFSHVTAATKAVFVLLPILGIPWFVGFFVGIESVEASVVFMYINATLNGLQGFFVFLLYCVFSSEIRTAIRKEYNKAQALSQLKQERSSVSDGSKTTKTSRFKFEIPPSLNPMRSRKSSEIKMTTSPLPNEKAYKEDNLVLGEHLSIPGTYRRRYD